jgi:hypothetical protein
MSVSSAVIIVKRMKRDVYTRDIVKESWKRRAHSFYSILACGEIHNEVAPSIPQQNTVLLYLHLSPPGAPGTTSRFLSSSSLHTDS